MTRTVVTGRALALLLVLAVAGFAQPSERVGTRLPTGSFHSPGGLYVDYTTPEARVLLDEIVREIDVPLGGRQAVRRVVIVDRLDTKSFFTASPPDTVLIGRSALEELGGGKISRRDPGSVARLLRSVLADQHKADVFKGLLAHEVGHLAQGHGRSLVLDTPAARAATAERIALQQSLGDAGFTQDLQSATRTYHQSDAQRRANLIASEDYSRVFAADRARVSAAIASGEDFASATRFMSSSTPAVPPELAGQPLPSRVLRISELSKWIESQPELFRGTVTDPVSIKVKRFMPSQTFVAGRDGTVRRDPSGARSLAAAMSIERPIPFAHADEFLADQHAVTLRFRQTGSIARSLAVMDGLGSNATYVQSDHPMRQTRILNAVDHIQNNPEIFGSGLDKPVRVPVYDDLPPVVLERGAQGIKVTGKDAVLTRVAAPERMIYERYRQAQDGYRSWVARHESRPVLGKLVPKTVDRYVVEGTAPGARVSSGIVRAGLSGALIGTALAAGADLVDQWTTTGETDLARTGRAVTSTTQLAGLTGGLAGGFAASALASTALTALGVAVSSHWAGRLAMGVAGAIGGMAGADLATGQKFDFMRALVGGLASGAVLALMGPGLLPGLVAIAAGIGADALYSWWKNREQQATAAQASDAPRLLDVQSQRR